MGIGNGNRYISAGCVGKTGKMPFKVPCYCQWKTQGAGLIVLAQASDRLPLWLPTRGNRDATTISRRRSRRTSSCPQSQEPARRDSPQGRELALGLALAQASIARTGPDVALTLAPTAFAELRGEGQCTAHRRRIDRCPAMCSAWQAIKRRGVGEIHRAQTRPGIHHASAWPSKRPNCARRPQQRGLIPLIGDIRL